MYISGNFKSIKDVDYQIVITDGDVTKDIKVIGEEGLFFSNDALSVETNTNDTFDTIIKTSATINLVSDSYVGHLLFGNNARSISVTIYKNNVPFFAGFVEPATFTQPFASVYDSFTVNCVDALSTLENYKYKEITTKAKYDSFKIDANTISFQDIMINSIFKDLLNLDKIKNKKTHIWYDGSKGIDNQSVKDVFKNIGISESYLIGDDCDDVMTDEDILKEILQYLNLHIMQIGCDYYIFDWDNLKKKNTKWYDLLSNEEKTETPLTQSLTEEMYASDDGNISIADVYNQLILTDELKKQDTIIESPLDDDSLYSLYKSKQLYMTEFSSAGEGNSAWDAFMAGVRGQSTTYDAYTETDWYMQVMESKNWVLKLPNNQPLTSIYEKENNQYVNQWKVAKYLYDNPLTPCLMSMGSVEKGAKATDNSVINKIDMSNYLIISVNGNEKDNPTESFPSVSDLKAHANMIEYIGKSSGAVYSPVDDVTTNYLVFSGKINLQPIVYESFDKKTLNDPKLHHGIHPKIRAGMYEKIRQYEVVKFSTVPSDKNGDGRYYTRKWYTTKSSTDEIGNNDYIKNDQSITPWTKEKALHSFEFKQVRIEGKDKELDTISKFPILECELKIGDKYCVEVKYNSFQSAKDDTIYAWLTKNEIKKGGMKFLKHYNITINLDELKYEDDEFVNDGWHEGKTTWTHTMSLGINPKIGDKIIGQDFDLQNNIDYTMNVDEEGTAIPIIRADNLAGKVSFKILGPFNGSLYQQVYYRHRTWFRRRKFQNGEVPLLPHVQNIFIKEFECKIASDNGKTTNKGDSDLIYQSAESEKYVNKKDDITFKFITQLSADEALAKNIDNGVNLNAVINMNTSLPLTSIYNGVTNEIAKAEEHYINSYYQEYSNPKLIYEVSLLDSYDFDFRNIYKIKSLNKDMHVMKIRYNCMDDSNTLTLKEI